MKKIKIIFLILLSIILFGCEKPNDDIILKNSQISENGQWNMSQKDIRQPREGEWQGDLFFSIPGIENGVLKNKSQIFHYIDGSTMFHNPDISTIELIWYYGLKDTITNEWDNVSDTIKVNNGKFEFSLVDYHEAYCGGDTIIFHQETYWKFSGYGEVINDTLYEYGILEYTMYRDKVLMIQSVSEWKSNLTFARTRHF